MTVLRDQTWTAMTAEERAQFERDGYLIIPTVLTEAEVAVARSAILRSYETAAHSDGLGPTAAVHRLSALAASTPSRTRWHDRRVGSAVEEELVRRCCQDPLPIRRIRRPLRQFIQQFAGVALTVGQVRPVGAPD